MASDLVAWSIAEANRARGSRTRAIGLTCDCGTDKWMARNGLNRDGSECVTFTCSTCGRSFTEDS